MTLETAAVPPPEIGWSSTRTATGTPMVWRMCPWCWGQRMILVSAGGRLRRCFCPNCLGIGEVLA